MNKQILLIYGGKSGEHKVSCVSAASIFSELINLGYTVSCIGITEDNIMYMQTPDMLRNKKNGTLFAAIKENEENIVSVIPGKGFYCMGNKLPVDVIFPVIHGSYGEDGRLQGLFDFLPIPYIGCNSFSSCLGFSKYSAKIFWEKSNLPVVPYLLVNEINPEITDEINNKFVYPLFVKPESSGSSLGVSKVSHPEELYAAMVSAIKVSGRILIEQAIEGREIECSIFGSNEDYFVSDPGEIITNQQFYTYEAKYGKKRETTIIAAPADLPEILKQDAANLTVRAFNSIYCNGLARVDMFFESSTGKLYLNEINTSPGFTDISMFIKLVEAGGVSWGTLLDKLIALAESEFRDSQLLQTKKAGV